MPKLKKRQRKVLGPGYEGKRELVSDSVENPYRPGEYEPVVKNARESSLQEMHKRGYINDAQKKAGEWFRERWEKASRIRGLAVDTSQPYVDRSGITDPAPVSVLQAGDELAKVAPILGLDGFRILELFIGEGHTMREVAAARADSTLSVCKAETYVGLACRTALTNLAVHLGFCSRPANWHTPYLDMGRGPTY